MLEPEKIKAKRFGTVKNGLNPSEVTSYIAELAGEIERLQKENEESEEKIMKLVEKINEYRDDEEAIKSAMVHAQKESNKLINDAKAKARDMIESAKTEQIRLQEMNASELEKLAAEHKEKCNALIAAQTESAKAEIEDIQAELEAERAELDRVKAETTYFKSELINLYTQQIQLISKMPEMSEEELAAYEEEYGEYYDDEYYDDEYYDEYDEQEQAELEAEQKHIDEVLNTASFEPIIPKPNPADLRFGNNGPDDQ
ncbi:MAG: DivIVA domain-containing protein [Ruminococcus sp.]|nr:DivIVA domain-containing protein [Ruminococcus sp.]